MSTPPPRAQIATFGPFAALSEGRRLAFPRRGAERLLAYLAVDGGNERGRVAAALWPEARREDALASLRQAVHAVAAAGAEGWVVANRATIRLASWVAIDLQEAEAGLAAFRRTHEPSALKSVRALASRSLLEGWSEAWIEPHRARWGGVGGEDSEDGSGDRRATEALFEIVAWGRERSPSTALRMAAEAGTLIVSASPTRVDRELAALFPLVDRLTEGMGFLGVAVARASYLVGHLESAFELYARVARECSGDVAGHSRLAQIVLLREAGGARAAADRAETLWHDLPKTPYFGWSARYHLGYTRHLAGDNGGLAMARAAVEAGMPDADPIVRLFPTLNVAEGLIDAGEAGAAREFLACAWGLALDAGDPLGMMTASLLEALAAAREGEREAALTRLRALGAEAWRARFAPFAAVVADRTAILAFSLGRPDEGRESVARADRIRRRLGVRRTVVERNRLAAAVG